jgi:hypothetical protein
MKKLVITFTIAIYTLLSLVAQTEIGGIIKTNEIFTKAKSPYIVNTDLIITQDGSITIEPGVEIKFALNTKLEVRGKLVANGSAQDSITFTSFEINIDSAYSWYGIEFANTNISDISFSYCKFLHAQNAIYSYCCNTENFKIGNSKFLYNNNAVYVSYSDTVVVENCDFTGNRYGIRSGTSTIKHSNFIGNVYGVTWVNSADIFNSEFVKNQQAIGLEKGSIVDCKITGNDLGISINLESVKLLRNIISNNSIGLQIFGGMNIEGSVDNCQICNNTQYNVQNVSKADIDLYTNCWCTSDSLAIETKINDGLDGPNNGRLSYSIFNESCDSVIKKVDKTPVEDTIHWIKANSPYLFTSDFVVYPNETLVIEPGVEARFDPWNKLEIRGRLVANGTKDDSITFTSKNIGDSTNSWYGLVLSPSVNTIFEISYCRFFNSANAVMSGVDLPKRLKITNSSFRNNYNSLINNYTDTVIVENCEFTSNRCGIQSGKNTIKQSKFVGNIYGVNWVNSADIFNSEFVKNLQAIGLEKGSIVDCKITGNETGVIITLEQARLLHNEISNNNIGVIIYGGINIKGSIDSCKICNNIQYNLQNASKADIALYSNCWCSTDSMEIENKISDGYDNSSSGLIDFIVYADNCNTPILKTLKRLKKSINLNNNYPNYSLIIDIIPNPVSDYFIIRTNYNGKLNIDMYNLTGQCIKTLHVDENIFVGDMKKGIYIIKARTDRFLITKKVCID